MVYQQNESANKDNFFLKKEKSQRNSGIEKYDN